MAEEKKSKEQRYRVGNLVFACKEDYKCFKYVDDNIHKILKSIEEGNVSEKVSDKLKKEITVKEYVPDGRDDLGALFPRMELLLLNFNKIAINFFDRIKVKEYSKYSRRIK